MKKFFNPTGGLLVGIMILVPYLLLGKKWDLLASVISIGMAIDMIAVAILYIKKHVSKDRHNP